MSFVLEAKGQNDLEKTTTLFLATMFCTKRIQFRAAISLCSYAIHCEVNANASVSSRVARRMRRF